MNNLKNIFGTANLGMQPECRQSIRMKYNVMPKEQHSFEVCTLTAMYTSNGEKNYYIL